VDTYITVPQHELAQQIPQVVLVHDDDVAQAGTGTYRRAARQSIGLWRGDRRQHGADADPPEPRDEVSAVRTVSIVDQEAGLLPEGVALVSWGQTEVAVASR